MFPFEKLALHKRRQELIGEVSGNVLEIGSGGGVNFNYYKKELISKLTILDLKFNKSIKSHKLNKEMDINSLTCSSEEKVDNGIYFCIKGTKVDGHNFAESAISNGTVCLVVQEFLDLPITQIKVENTRVAMSYISSVFYETYKSKMKFVGVTGTNGKTTTTFLIRNILRNLNKTCL